MRIITKPLLIPLLFGYYVLSASEVMFLVALALAFGWLGDVLLLGKKEIWFIAGLAAFLTGHIMYILVFISDINASRLQPLELVSAVILLHSISPTAARAGTIENSSHSIYYGVSWHELDGAAQNVDGYRTRYGNNFYRCLTVQSF